MKYVFIGALALMSVILPSCRKETFTDNIPLSGSKKLLLKEAFSGYYKDTTHYEYDAQNRLVKVFNKSDVFSFVYIGNTVKVKDFRPEENRQVYDVLLNLDGNKRITEIHGNAEFVVDKPYVTNTVYEYNANGYMLTRTDSRSTGKIYKTSYTWSNGDLTRIDRFIDGILSYYSLFEYSNQTDLNEIDKYKFESAVTGNFVGTNSKHLIKKASAYSITDALLSSTDYAYTLDAEGYPVTGTLKTSYGDVSGVVYSYNK